MTIQMVEALTSTTVTVRVRGSHPYTATLDYAAPMPKVRVAPMASEVLSLALKDLEAGRFTRHVTPEDFFGALGISQD